VRIFRRVCFSVHTRSGAEVIASYQKCAKVGTPCRWCTRWDSLWLLCAPSVLTTWDTTRQVRKSPFDCTIHVEDQYNDSDLCGLTCSHVSLHQRHVRLVVRAQKLHHVSMVARVEHVHPRACEMSAEVTLQNSRSLKFVCRHWSFGVFTFPFAFLTTNLTTNERVSCRGWGVPVDWS
jgi:hypothetical protein